MESITRNVTDLGNSDRQALEQVLGQSLSDDELVILQVVKAPRRNEPVAPSPTSIPAPRDEWERRLRAIAINCGTSVSDVAVSSEGIYD